jgi:hypothetical protein
MHVAFSNTYIFANAIALPLPGYILFHSIPAFVSLRGQKQTLVVNSRHIVYSHRRGRTEKKNKEHPPIFG